jgi:hypothetical protein
VFPGAGAVVYRNEAGEPLGWDYPSDGPDEEYFYDRESFEMPDMECGCFSDQKRHTCNEFYGEWLDPNEAVEV